MPNGHGGFVRFFSPVVLLLFLAGILARRFKHDDVWTLPLAFILAGLAGERLAWHLQMWGISEYSGAYASPAEISSARLRYALTAMILIAGGLFLVTRFK